MRCGRKWGKTVFSNYTLHRWALTIPNGQFYYVAPFYNQASEIIWHSGVMPNFLGPYKDKYVETIRGQEKRIIFRNGSFIKLVGSDNYEAGRGFNPNGAVYDEFKDHDKRFDDGFRPNLIAKVAPLVIVGTPPETEDHFFCRTEEEFKDREDGFHITQSTYDNPHIDRKELDIEKKGYEKRGEWGVWMREHMAVIVPGSASSIFPMFEAPQPHANIKHTKHVRPHKELLEKVMGRHKDYEFYALYDPGSVVCFAVTFMCVHKYTKQVIILAEIYETDKSRTSTKQIYPRSIEIMVNLIPGIDWDEYYDYAASWFQNEVQNEYQRNIMPCQKDLGKKKEEKLSLIKDFMLEGLFLISDACPETIREISIYATDDKGRIPKEDDHSIDTIRYGFNAANISTVPRQRKVKDEDRRIWVRSDDDEFEEEEDQRLSGVFGFGDLEEEFDDDDIHYFG